MSAQLTYYIFEGVLTGFAGEKTIHMTALSGGRGGSRLKNVTTDAANNPYLTGLATSHSKGIHGGPIPTGRYAIETPKVQNVGEHKILAAKLVESHKLANGRGGFFIHGRGPHGSDGCIVPSSDSKFDELMTALRKDSGGVLYVQQAMGSAFA